MTKSELISRVAGKTGFTKKDSGLAVEAVLEAIAETLASGERVSLVGFGVFSVRARVGRVGRNPRTNKPMTIAAREVPVFKPGKSLKDRIGAK